MDTIIQTWHQSRACRCCAWSGEWLAAAAAGAVVGVLIDAVVQL